MPNTILAHAVLDLQQQLLMMASLTAKSVRNSTRAVLTRDENLAFAVEKDDSEIKQLAIDIDKRVLQFLYRERPVAHDLRLAITATKLSRDMEQIGRAARHIAESAQHLLLHPPVKVDVDMQRMASHAGRSLNDVISNFIDSDTSDLYTLLQDDTFLSDSHQELVYEMTRKMEENPKCIRAAQELISISSALDSIGHACRSIAEELIFLKEARDVRTSARII